MVDNPWDWFVPGEKTTTKGGPGSGNFGHVGIPGHQGGSALAGHAVEAAGRESLIHETVSTLQKLFVDNPWGFSYRPVAGSPTEGNMVSLHRREDNERPMGFSDANFQEKLLKSIDPYVRKRINQVMSTPELHFGGWLNDKDGQYYLDLSTRVNKKGDAWNLAKKNEQIAWYNIGEGHQYDTASMKPEDFVMDDFELTEPPDGVREKQLKGAYKMSKDGVEKVGEVTVFPRPKGASEADIQSLTKVMVDHIAAALTDWFKRHYTDKGLTIEDYYTDYPERRPKAKKAKKSKPD
jgi:hypothetical protein